MRKGFTLIELVLYIGIAVVVIGSASVFLLVVLTARVENQVIAEVEQQGLYVMQRITQEIRNAQAIDEPVLGASSSNLSLAVADKARDPVVFTASGGIIVMTESGGSTYELTSQRLIASPVVFDNLSRSATPGTVRIRFTLTHVNPGARQEYDYARTFYGSASIRPQ